MFTWFATLRGEDYSHSIFESPHGEPYVINIDSKQHFVKEKMMCALSPHENRCAHAPP